MRRRINARTSMCAIAALLTASSAAPGVAQVPEDESRVEIPRPSPEERSELPREDYRAVAHAFATGPGGVHGEVTIMRSADSQIVETLLYSRVLKRVVAEIAARESKAWPPNEPGGEDSVRYLEALERSRDRVWWNSAHDPSAHDRLQEMSIEVALDDRTAGITIFSVRTRQDAGDRRAVVERSVLETLTVDRAYARREQQLIVEDTFAVDAVGALKLLGREP